MHSFACLGTRGTWTFTLRGSREDQRWNDVILFLSFSREMRSGISSGASLQNISKTVNVSIDVVGLTNHATVNQTQYIRLKTVGMVKSKVRSKKLDYLITNPYISHEMNYRWLTVNKLKCSRARLKSLGSLRLAMLENVADLTQDEI